MSDIEKSAESKRVHTAAQLHVTTVLADDDLPIVTDHVMDADEEVLVALGYKQEFKREFSLLSSFSVSFSVLGLLPSVASTLGYNMGYAGPVGMVWGWVVAATLIQFVVLSMAELCSSMPTSGGLYYASAVLAPDGWGPLAAWITGWSNFIGQATGPASVDYSLAAMIMAAISLANDSFVPTVWQTYLLFLLLLALHGTITSLSTKLLARINVFSASFNFVALVVALVVIPAASIQMPKLNSAQYVFTTFVNGTGWPDGFAFLMSWLAVIWTMSGYDAPFHLAEEASNANVAAPRAIVMTGVSGGILGWFLNLVLAYVVQDIGAVMASPVGQPMGSLLLSVLGPSGGVGMFSLVIICQFCMGQSCLTAASRVVYAYSRDGALPGSRLWAKVNPYTRTPVNGVWFVVGIAALLGLLAFASPAAIGAIFAIGAVAQYVAFIVPIFLRVFVVGNRFRPGPWNLGRWSRPIGFVACCYVALITPILFFPSAPLPILTAMNWACVVYGGSMGLALIWYAVAARKWFRGPRVNIEHRMYARDPLSGISSGEGKSESYENVLEAEENEKTE
ncbi:amino acid transporter [Calocera viscosa TUFC12733]|uniref:Amino acid transporter n=1 Tax=Calocera viscosa (strain TUFC12733) TaxID=1330018 RepID=A0A167KXL1_CALVF|nr:amino acid transporter [Calocera viscosa TUFC12733]